MFWFSNTWPSVQPEKFPIQSRNVLKLLTTKKCQAWIFVAMFLFCFFTEYIVPWPHYKYVEEKIVLLVKLCGKVFTLFESLSETDIKIRKVCNFCWDFGYSRAPIFLSHMNDKKRNSSTKCYKVGFRLTCNVCVCVLAKNGSFFGWICCLFVSFNLCAKLLLSMHLRKQPHAHRWKFSNDTDDEFPLHLLVNCLKCKVKSGLNIFTTVEYTTIWFNFQSFFRRQFLNKQKTMAFPNAHANMYTVMLCIYNKCIWIFVFLLEKRNWKYHKVEKTVVCKNKNALWHNQTMTNQIQIYDFSSLMLKFWFVESRSVFHSFSFFRLTNCVEVETCCVYKMSSTNGNSAYSRPHTVFAVCLSHHCKLSHILRKNDK